MLCDAAAWKVLGQTACLSDHMHVSLARLLPCVHSATVLFREQLRCKEKKDRPRPWGKARETPAVYIVGAPESEYNFVLVLPSRVYPTCSCPPTHASMPKLTPTPLTSLQSKISGGQEAPQVSSLHRPNLGHRRYPLLPPGGDAWTFYSKVSGVKSLSTTWQGRAGTRRPPWAGCNLRI